MLLHHSKIKAFTLIELLIVIVIIGILAVAFIPRLIDTQGRAKDTARKADVRQLQMAFMQYANENNGKYPVSPVKCLGLSDQEKCRIWYVRRDAGNPAGFSGSTSLTTLLQPYMNSIPSDPIGWREIWDKYIYYNTSWPTPIHCSWVGEYIYNKAFIARQPSKIDPSKDSICAPWKFACCGALWCTSYTDNMNFCVLQLEE